MNKKEIENIITDYRKLRTQHPDYWLIDCAAATSLEHAVEMAATARNLVGRKHPHQFRIQNSVLQDFSLSLLSIKFEIREAASFRLLYSLVDGCRIKGISDLTIYDTSHRIGCFLNLFPEEVYLHSGTRKGAEIILGKIMGKTILVEQLPPLFNSGLSPSELEDMLCIYKSALQDSLINKRTNKC
ncbi:hypothetical protein [Pedobacter jeongneungensis]|uniref:hypothetical protein n=1 Tax=Pedobacter jeongneungensis TaxID=947309 RepID=UPI0031EADF95